ncbi:helix-turn-helix domain-containing protein [Saccharothrix isguenensis]
MAKKPLKRPELPEGARLEFFLHLQDLVLRHGDLPVSRLASEAGVSHQTVYKALTGPKVPSRSTTEALARSLAGEEAAATALLRWESAVAEERGLDSSVFVGTTAKSSGIHETTRPITSARQELALRLKQAYEDSSVKLEYIANQAGVLSRSSAYDILAGRSLPRWVVLERLAQVLGVDPGSIRPLYEDAVRDRELDRQQRPQSSLRRSVR